MATFAAIVAAAFGSSGLFTFLIHIFDARSGRKSELAEIAEIVRDSQQGLVRLQLLNLIQHAPDMHAEIMEVARRYFDELGGNWYMESIFTEWASEQGVPLPAWFRE